MFWVGILLGMKLGGKFVEILIFSEQSDRSRCLPKSRILVVLDTLRTSFDFWVWKRFG